MKEFKITEEQIKENKDLTLKEYFKEVFETKLEAGKWYKDETSDLLYFPLCIKNNNNIRAYGFTRNGIYDNDDLNYKWGTPENIRLATEQEVFDALKKEAEKRGFVKGAKVKDNGLCSTCKQNEILKNNTFDFDLRSNQIWMCVGEDNYVCLIFENGKWAEIISQPEEIIELNGVKYKRID